MGFHRFLRTYIVVEAELYAIMTGLRMSRQIGLQRVILYSDSLNAINIIMRDCYTDHPLRVIIGEHRLFCVCLFSERQTASSKSNTHSLFCPRSLNFSWPLLQKHIGLEQTLFFTLKFTHKLTTSNLHFEGSEMGSGAGNFLKVILRNFDVLAGPVVSLAYPLYASIQAIETKNPIDDQQWLTYWIMYSMITLFELTFFKVLEWIPIWPYAKLILTCWLVLPYFNGAAYVYDHYVRPFFLNPRTVNIWYVPGKKDQSSKPDDILTAAEKYIQEHGTREFESLINRADKSRSGGYRGYDESYAY